MKVGNPFTAHPASVGETYSQHLFSALSFSGALLRAAAVCAVHAAFPFAFEKTGSDAVENLYDRMRVNRTQGDRKQA